MTSTVARVILAPRERQVLEGLADGSTLAAVALDLKVREGTAAGYLKLAKAKLYGMGDLAAALAVGYATEAITRPELLDPTALNLPEKQRDLVPLVAQGMRAVQMATKLNRPIGDVRRDGRDLMANLGGTPDCPKIRNQAHLVTRAWQYQVLTADQVIAWLP
ncbi:hypothetical protein [Streptomyces sp. NBC_01304]|uniref:hypothetical protein n=1 Tax=Streptomyces sp. NBC_01304 TaxID=2903818 RepID=UPI002E15BF87|nr:hypothetical protein OG430_13660 [Streptomyces sp. NBC_01304]